MPSLPYPHSKEFSSQLKSYFANAKKRNLVKYRGNPELCMNCGAKTDFEQLEFLDCECRQCFTCLDKTFLNCLVCETPLQSVDNEKILRARHFMSNTKHCSICNKKTFLECQCMCRACIVQKFDPNNTICQQCHSPYNSSLINNCSRTCSFCNKQLGIEQFRDLPCNCAICIPCLTEIHKTLPAFPYCRNCKRFYKTPDRYKLSLNLSDLFPAVVTFSPYCVKCNSKTDLLCKCRCRRCVNAPTGECQLCREIRREPVNDLMSCPNSIMLDAPFNTLCEMCRLSKFCPMLHQDCPVCIECVKTSPRQCPICGDKYNEAATAKLSHYW